MSVAIVVASGRADDVDQRLRVEDVVAHRGEHPRRVAGHGRRVAGLFVEGDDLAVSRRLDDAELRSFVDRHRDGRDRDTGADLHVMLDHLAGIHVVDVIGAEHAHDVGSLVADEVEVLIDRVGGTAEPLRAAAHLGRHGRDVVAEQRREPPCLADVAVEAVALVLREHDDLQEPRVGEVRQHEIDDSIAAPERHRRLGPVGRQRVESLAFPTRQHDHENLGFSHAAAR